MQLYLQGIAYTELNGSPRKCIGWTTRSGVRQFLVDWVNRDAFAAALISYTSNSGIGTGSQTTTPIPYPGDPLLICTKVDYEPWGKPGQNPDGTALYTTAKVTAQYNTPGYIMPTGTPSTWGNTGLRVTERLAFSTESLNLPCGMMMYDDASANIPGSGMNIFIGQIAHNITVENSLVVPIGNIASCMGKVNASTWYGMDPSTCLLISGSTEPTIGADGTRTYTVTLQFLERQIRWDQIYRRPVSTTDDDFNVTAWADGPIELDYVYPSPYKTADFGIIFA
jgi:hypothetical protein